jgi:tRNA modification GTPase
MALGNDTICAVATPAGRGGISVVRVSGQECRSICEQICGSAPAANVARLSSFIDDDGQLIDQGIVVFFAGPHSFTGEDVLELQTHGSPIVTDLLIQRLLRLGARIARPGEFSERAFLNDKLDLAQAEAIADLISSASASAARFALRSLKGEFSRLVDGLVEQVTLLRVYIEASLDFPEEEVDFLTEGAVGNRLAELSRELENIRRQARQGALVREGIKVAIAGQPNAGKSTLLNALSGEDAAIVTDIPGTTRDILRMTIDIEGLPIHILDTAGLRHSDDPVEQEGIRRARKAIEEADLIMLVVDARERSSLADNLIWQQLSSEYGTRLLLVFNKIDLASAGPEIDKVNGIPVASISAKQHIGLDNLRDQLKTAAGFTTREEGGFIARRRHLDALERADAHLSQAIAVMSGSKAGELVAEELHLMQSSLGEITGKVSSDALLGRIFSSFCIGK